MHMTITGDLGSIPGSERSPGEGNGNPLQYSCWRIPWTEEPGGLQSVGSQRVRNTWAAKQHTHTQTWNKPIWKGCILHDSTLWPAGRCKTMQTVKISVLLRGWGSGRDEQGGQVLNSVEFSHSVVSDSLPSHELQHTRASCPSPTPRVHPNPYPLSWWLPSDHLILCHPLLLPSVFPSIRVFSNDSVLHIRWPKY